MVSAESSLRCRQKCQPRALNATEHSASVHPTEVSWENVSLVMLVAALCIVIFNSTGNNEHTEDSCTFSQTVWPNSTQFEHRITAGKSVNLKANAEEGQVISSMCSFQNQSGYHLCGAVIVGGTSKAHTVLTDAHCFFDSTASKVNDSFQPLPAHKFKLRCGSMNYKEGILVNIDRALIHPNYTYETNKMSENDIVAIRVHFPSHVKVHPMALSSATNCAQLNFSQVVRVYGWGHVSEGSGANTQHLQVVQLPIGDCVDNLFTTNTEYGRDSCQGDSGGPVVQNNKLLGLILSGIGCGRMNSNSFNLLVPAYEPWFNSSETQAYLDQFQSPPNTKSTDGNVNIFIRLVTGLWNWISGFFFLCSIVAIVLFAAGIYFIVAQCF